MPFPRSVKEDVLVRSARHCCVCHDSKRRDVYVHHIVQEADGGPNTAENAIALCHDCHSAAGHYNSRHPLGTKYSATELKLHRDQWFQIVEKNQIAGPTDDSSLTVRYLICKDPGVAADVLNGEVGWLPLGPALLAPSPVRDHFRSMDSSTTESFYSRSIPLGKYKTIEKYLRARPGASIDRELEGTQRCELGEIDSRTLRELSAKSDLVSQVAELGYSPLLVGQFEITWYHRAIDEPCFQTDTRVREHFVLPQMLLLLLVLTNDGDSSVTLTHLDGVAEGEGTIRTPLYREPSEPTHSMNLPAVPIVPGESVVVPLSVLFAEDSDDARWSAPRLVSSETLEEFGPRQNMGATDYGSLRHSALCTGPAFWPGAIRYSNGSANRTERIRACNLSLTYEITRGWEVGSCPHLFFVTPSGEVSYVREILVSRSDVTEEIALPSGVSRVVIAELEAELTVIRSIQVEGSEVYGPAVLRPGQWIDLPVDGARSLTVVGHYQPVVTSARQKQGLGGKRGLIDLFIADPTWFAGELKLEAIGA